MSEENKTDDVKNKITISSDDCANVKKYCGHFGVPSSDGLEKALDTFSADPTYKNQVNVKLEVCKWMLSCSHESFGDSLWDAPKKAAEEVVFDLQFDRDLEEVLTDKDKEKES
jgi:hypothetical protein